MVRTRRQAAPGVEKPLRPLETRRSVPESEREVGRIGNSRPPRGHPASGPRAGRASIGFSIEARSGIRRPRDGVGGPIRRARGPSDRSSRSIGASFEPHGRPFGPSRDPRRPRRRPIGPIDEPIEATDRAIGLNGRLRASDPNDLGSPGPYLGPGTGDLTRRVGHLGSRVAHRARGVGYLVPRVGDAGRVAAARSATRYLRAVDARSPSPPMKPGRITERDPRSREPQRRRERRGRRWAAAPGKP
jgi:hypothetical protein